MEVCGDQSADRSELIYPVRVSGLFLSAILNSALQLARQSLHSLFMQSATSVAAMTQQKPGSRTLLILHSELRAEAG